MTGKVASGNNSTLAMRNRAAIPLDITTESSVGDILPLSLMTNQYTGLQGFLFRSSTTSVGRFTSYTKNMVTLVSHYHAVIQDGPFVHRT